MIPAGFEPSDAAVKGRWLRPLVEGTKIISGVQFQSHASLMGLTNRNWGILRGFVSAHMSSLVHRRLCGVSPQLPIVQALFSSRLLILAYRYNWRFRFTSAMNSAKLEENALYFAFLYSVFHICHISRTYKLVTPDCLAGGSLSAKSMLTLMRLWRGSNPWPLVWQTSAITIFATESNWMILMGVEPMTHGIFCCVCL